MDTQIIGLAAAYLIVEVTKFLVGALSKKPPVVGALEKERIGDLWKWSMKVAPEDIHGQNEKILDLMKTMVHTQQQQADLLERLVDTFKMKVVK